MEQLFSSPTCFQFSSVFGADKIFITILFLSLYVMTFVLLRRDGLSTKSRILFIYAHLSFLFFPLMLLTANTGCGLFCASCHNNLPALTAYALPATLAASALAGFVVMPSLFILVNKRGTRNRFILRAIRKYAKALEINAPPVYIVNKARPMAFSFSGLRPSIFLSVGLLDILRKKEVEAVLLHEIAHIRNISSVLKVSNRLLKLSPFFWTAGFGDVGREERKADDFVSAAHRTRAHLRSAKQKIAAFERAATRGK